MLAVRKDAVRDVLVCAKNGIRVLRAEEQVGTRRT
jgi:hypothetical protein